MMLRITIFNHVAALLSFFIMLILMFIGLLYFNFDKIAIFIFSIMVVVDAIPALYLHIQYFLINIGFTYEVSDRGITEYHKNSERFYERDNIEEVSINMPSSTYQGSNIHILSIESYHYARIVMKDGEEIIFTCLLTPKVEEAIKILEVPYTRKKNNFCEL